LLPLGEAAPDHVGKGLPVVTFESFLELTLTTRLNKIPPCYYVEEDFRDVRIANITFSFDNSEMIKLLSERGVLVTAGKLDSLSKIN